MGKNSKIEWCDHTWNPWFGCTEVGPACDFCYARVLMDERYGKVTWGAGADRIRTSEANWREPFKWDRAASVAGKIATVFCLSLGDIWDNEVDPIWRRDAFDVMRRTPNLFYLLLSKRIGNAPKMCDPFHGNPLLPSNCALGSTMINQEEWDRDIRKLKDAAILLQPRFTFASVEPMLGAIDARNDLPDWVIVGGESGPHARPMHPEWARDLHAQCKFSGVPFFFKQWGEWLPSHQGSAWKPIPDNVIGPHCIATNGAVSNGGELKGGPEKRPLWCMIQKVGKKAAGRLLDGVEHSEWPEVRS
jgi:protein gp37